MECNTSRPILALDIACLELKSKKLVHRFVNNYTNRVACGFEFAGLKTQAKRATLRLLDLCTRICRQVSGIVISKTMY